MSLLGDVTSPTTVAHYVSMSSDLRVLIAEKHWEPRRQHTVYRNKRLEFATEQVGRLCFVTAVDGGLKRFPSVAWLAHPWPNIYWGWSTKTETDFFHRCFIDQAQCLHGLFQNTPPVFKCTSYRVAAIPRTHDAGHSFSGSWESPHFSSALLQRSQIECPGALSLVMGIRSHREQDWGCKAVMLNAAKNCMT